MTPNFSFKEMTITNTGIKNTLLKAHEGNLTLTAYGMENVRAILGHKPITVTSAYRNKLVNARVGGVANSDHALGFACDFFCKHMFAGKAFDILRASYLIFDQIILERNDTLIHISFNPRLRGEVMRQRGGPGSYIERLDR